MQLVEAHPATGVHDWQVRSAVALHAPLSYDPMGHAPTEHASHAVPVQNRPALQSSHVASALVVQRTDAHPAIGVHPLQTRSDVALHAALSYVPAAHAPSVHGSHAMPLQNNPGSHALHVASAVVVQLTDVHPAIDGHAVHSRSVCDEHGTDSNRPSAHAAEHARHAVPSEKNSASHAAILHTPASQTGSPWSAAHVMPQAPQ